MSASLLKRQRHRHAFCSILRAVLLLPLLIFVHAGMAADATWSGGTGTLLWSTGTNWTPASAPGATTGITNPDIATFNTALGATAITIDTGRNLRNLTFTTGAGSTFTIGSAGANAGETLLLTSGGSVTMNSGNTATVVLNAPIVIEPTSSSGNGSYTFTNNSTAVGTSDTNQYKLTINGSISGGATTGLITLNFTGTTGNRSGDATGNVMNGVISNGLSGGVSVTITGSGQIGVWQLTNSNSSYTGITSVTSGTLIFNSIANIGVNSSIGAGNTLNMASGTFVKYAGGEASTDRAITGTGALYNIGTGALTLNGTVNAGLTFRGSQNFIVNGLISGNSGIVRTDPGTVFLNNNNNSFTGAISISDGAFQVTSIYNNGINSAAGNTGNLNLGQASGTIGRFEYTGASTSTDRLIVMQNSSTVTGSTGRGTLNVMTAGQTLVFTNGIRLANTFITNDATNFSDLTLTGIGNGEIQGQIGGTNAAPNAVVNMKIIKTGPGTWTLSGANKYALQTTISAGILNIRNSSALGAVETNETVPSAANAGTTVASGATLQLQNNISVGAEALSLAGTGAAGQNGALVNVSGTNSFAGALTLTANTTISSDSGSLALTNTTAIVGSGSSRALTLTGAGNGSLASSMDATGVASLTKNGSGIWMLSGTNSYTGATTVNAGTLNVTGTLGNTSVTVASGAAFAYAGALGGSLTAANNATIIIGDALTAGSTGTLTVGGNLTLNDSTVLLFDLGTSSDLIQANGSTITLDGIVRVTQGAGFTAGTYKLIGYTGAMTNNGLVAQMLAGYNLSIVVDTVNQAVNLVATGINAQYWDGTDTVADNVVDGGNGTWTNAGTNWTLADGSNNTSWSASVEKIAIFGGAVGGTVQVQDTVAVNGLQFARSYTLANSGGQIQITNAATEVRVDTGSTATVAAPVTGAGGINKTGDGTLIFTAASGSNTYAGSTLITSGTLKIGTTNTLPTNTAVTVGSDVFTGALDLSSASQQIASLQIASNNANAYSTVTIGAGQTLTVNGSMSIGIANNVKTVTRAIITGPGSLVINNTNANFEAGLQTATSLLPNSTAPFDNNANANTVTSDFTGLGSFTANVKEFRVGFGVNVTSTLLLSDTSNSITANVVQLSNSNGLNSGSSTTVLGAGTNIIATDTLNIGVSKGVATLKFASQTAGSAGTVVIGGKTGATTNIIVGSTLGTATGAQPTGTLDLRGHTATITAGALIIGKRDSGGGGGAAGFVYFDGGTFTANSVEMGSMSGNSGTTSPGPSGSGTLIISGGSFTVNSGGSFVMATYANTNGFGNAAATLTISGGTLISNVNITEGGGVGATTANTTSTIKLTGGTLDMTGHSIGDATNVIDILTLESGTLKDVQEINGGGAVTKSNTGILILLGTNTYTGATTIAAGTLQAGNGGTSGTLGSGDVINNATLAFNRSDLLTVANNVSGSGVVNQTGTGTTVLKGANTYTGQTTVSAGSLLVNNAYAGADSATGTNTVQVNANGTLGGTGRMAGSVNLAANATLAPGGNAATIAAGTPGLSTEIGTMLIGGNLTVGASATVSLQLKSGDTGLTATFDSITNRLTSVSGTATDGGNDRIIVNGTLTLDSASTISVTLGSNFTGGYQSVFDLVDWTGANISLGYYDSGTGMRVGGTADNAGFALDLPDLTIYNSTWYWDVSQFGSTGVIAIVPEASRALLLLGGLLGLGLRRRRARTAD